MIYCADCGGAFGRKTWHSNTKYERRIWRCNNKYARGKPPCATPHVADTDVEQAFIEALAERVKSNTGARNALEILEATVFDMSELEAQRDRAAQQVEEITVLIDQLVLTAVQTAIDPDEYDQKYAELEARYNQACTKRADLESQITDRHARLEQARTICDFLDSNPPLEYRDDAWSLLVDHAMVDTEGAVSVRFKDEATGAYGPEAGGQF